MKVKIRIAEIARQNGFNHAFALQNALKCSPTMAARLWSGEFKRIDIETMVKLGELFQCSPNDLIVYESAPVAPVKADKPKQKGGVWTGKPGGGSLAEILAEENSGKPFNNSVLDIVQSSSDNEFNLTTAAAGELLGLKPRTVRENAEKGLLHGKQGKQNHWFFRRSDVAEYKARRDKE
jgi:DNA-binding Xre family transcriptional regulator